MARVVFFLLIVAVIAMYSLETSAQDDGPVARVGGVGGPQRRCHRPHEVWRSCGSSCPPTCEKPNPTCISVCRRGCQCERGYYRRSDGACVRLNDCRDRVIDTE